MATKSSAKERRRSRRRAAIVLVPTVAGVFVAGTAFAYWTTSGTGTGSGTSGTSDVVTVSQTSTVTGLVPGGAAQAINFKINNPKSTKQYISSVDIQVGSIISNVTSLTAVGCSAADFDIRQPDALDTDLDPGDTFFTTKNATIAMKNTNYNQNGCKNVTLSLNLTAA
ncbi:hypothetical protein [Actinoplanes friuliensis]|jgi:hypothetical protein|uniref:hypothetical protein n=1 Tax=Actinoplanes friuliensis TaxID=196914 RepID=UPI0011DCC347|nr:hypothetical protein [Actinoplanes friuliensis]